MLKRVKIVECKKCFCEEFSYAVLSASSRDQEKLFQSVWFLLFLPKFSPRILPCRHCSSLPRNKKIYEISCCKIPECVLRELTSAGKIGKMRQTSRTASPYKSGPYRPSDTNSRRTRSTSSSAFQPPASVRQGVWPGKGSSSSTLLSFSCSKISIPSDAPDQRRRQLGGSAMIDDSVKSVKLSALVTKYLRRWLVTICLFSLSKCSGREPPVRDINGKKIYVIQSFPRTLPL